MKRFYNKKLLKIRVIVRPVSHLVYQVPVTSDSKITFPLVYRQRFVHTLVSRGYTLHFDV